MKKLLIILILALAFIQAKAQVSLAPTAVYLDRNGMGTLFVSNNSGVPQEINISFQFGYPDEDQFGVLIMRYDDTANAKNHSLESMVKAFPRTFILPPNQTQQIRLQVRPNKDQKHGVYFTRLKVGSTPQIADVGVTDVQGVNTRISVKFEQVIVAFYKVGQVSTGVKVDRIDAQADSNILRLDAHYQTSGNGPYVGMVKFKVTAPDGNVVAEGSRSVSLYFSGRRRYSFALPGKVPSGNYQVELRYETTRNDIAQEDLVEAAPYTYKATVRIP
ncbi:MAG: hypothetical protein ACK417_07840 [Bacteroidia bacterium]